MARNPVITIDTNNPDPSAAINAFLWCLSKAHKLGMSPPTEHILAAQLFCKSAKIMFYSSMNGTTSLVMDESGANDLADDDCTFEAFLGIMRRQAKRKRARMMAAQAIEAATALRAQSDAEVERNDLDTP